MSSEDTKQPQAKGELKVVEAEAYGSKESGGGIYRAAAPHVSNNRIYEQVAASRDDTHSKGDGFCRGLCAGLCCYCCLDMCF